MQTRNSAGNYISYQDLKDRMVYGIFARSSSVGVWNKESGEFLVVRVKWGEEYIFPETHWNDPLGPGTAKPIKELGMLPDDIQIAGYESLSDLDGILIPYLRKIEKQVKEGDFDDIPDAGE